MSSKADFKINIWQDVVTFSVFIASVYIPLKLVMDLESNRVLLIIDWVVTIIFITDAINNLLSGKRSGGNPGLNEGENETNDSEKYKLSWFIIDLFAAIPFGIFTGIVYLEVLRLAKLARVAQYMHNWRQRAVRFGDYLNLAFFFYWLFIATHWLACGWLSLSSDQTGTDDLRNYLTSLYWCTQTLTTVGYGDVDVNSNGQIVYAMVIMLFGVAMYGYVIGNVANILAKRDPAKVQFFKNIDALKAFVRFRDIPFELQKRIRDYYAYIWKQRLGYDESEFMRELPEGLKNEVTSFLKKDILEKIPLFKGISDKFVREVSLHLRPVVYTPGDYVFREGDRGNEMYFVIKGKLKVMSGDETVIYNNLSDGDFFGEIALFKNQPRTATVQAITYSDLYTLEKEVFEHVLENYPEITDQIKKISEERLENSDPL